MDLAGNPITEVSEAVQALNKLTYLNLGLTALGSIPESVYQLRKLTVLSVDSLIGANSVLLQSATSCSNLEQLHSSLKLDADNVKTYSEVLRFPNIPKLICEAVCASPSVPWCTHFYLGNAGDCLLVPDGCTPGSKSTWDYYQVMPWSISPAVGNLSQLQVLVVSNNRMLRGSIPDSLYKLNQLNQLDLHGNRLQGSIPESLYQLKKLTKMILRQNHLTGTISQAVQGLNQLTTLDLSGNLLRGSIPETLYALNKLVYFELFDNLLDGTISEAVQRLNALSVLDLHKNGLRGTIPESLYHNCTKLVFLNLFQNHLTGTVSEAVQHLNALAVLDLHDNGLRGTIPVSTYKLSKLVLLSLSTNHLTGTISEAVQQLNALTVLNLGTNMLRGAIPESLYSCTTLVTLSLSGNRFTGTISEAVQQLNALTALTIGSNMLQGSIPESMYKLSKLGNLNLYQNNLTGTISEAIHDLDALTVLDLDTNVLRGSIPASLCNCTVLSLIRLNNNHLSGSLPVCLGTSKALTRLYLRNNALSGNVPAMHGSSLQALDLGANRLNGSLPSMLPVSLVLLGLDNNKFHGTLSQALASMNQLSVLLLSNNSFDGPIPNVNSSSLLWAQFDRNRLGGPVPWEGLLLSTQLQVLSLASNQLSGSIAAQLPSSISQLLLDNNRFSGRLPSFEELGALHTLTVHENQCHGKLHLPRNASSLRAVFAHNNRGLSCPISVGSNVNDTALQAQNLLLAGNRFSYPIPAWAVMEGANAMYVAAEFDQWRERFVYAAIGLPLLLGCVVAVHGKAVSEFFVFTPDRGLEHFQWWSAKAIAIMSVPFLLLMLPLYGEGANLYECGEVWLKTTITYLSDSRMIEWLVAFFACAAAVMQSCLLMAMRCEVDANFPSPAVVQYRMSRSADVMMVLIWLVVLVVFSVPTVLYALSTALPTDNTLGLSETALKLSNQAAVVMLYLIIVMVAPYTAEWVVKKVTRQAEPDAYQVTRLVLLTRLSVGVLVPTAVTFLFSNECLSFWSYLWRPCANSASSFDVVVQMQPPGNYAAGTALGYFTSFAHPYTVTTHSQICITQWKPQRCSRAVFDVVGNLILSKATLDAFLVPGSVMLMSMPFVTKPAERIWKRLYPQKEFEWYRGDVELTFILMFFEYTFMFGFIMPLILPLIVVGLLLNCAVFRCCVGTLNLPAHDPVRPPFEYLYIARAIGMGFLIWFFFDNALAGQWLVYVGVPVCAIVGDLVASRVWAPPSLQNRASYRSPLFVPLLGPDERQSQDQVLTDMTDDPLMDAMIMRDNVDSFRGAGVFELKANSSGDLGRASEHHEGQDLAGGNAHVIASCI